MENTATNFTDIVLQSIGISNAYIYFKIDIDKNDLFL